MLGVRSMGEADWRARAEAHRARVDPLIEPRLERRFVGRKHPVEDFLFEYYAYRPGQLRRWHPGADVRLEGGAHDYRGLRGYRTPGADAVAPVAGLVPARERLASTVDLLERTADRAPEFGCFGRHEWAMVHGLDPDDVRHASWPLRLSVSEIHDVVSATPLACTHFDAIRFYTDTARPLNTVQPTRATQSDFEQPGCLHAGMDLYKWAFMFSPWVASETIVDCFVLARAIRDVDMRVAPYDLQDLGFEPIRIETPEGRAEFVRLQREFSLQQQAMRLVLLRELASLRDALHDCVDAPGRA